MADTDPAPPVETPGDNRTGDDLLSALEAVLMVAAAPVGVDEFARVTGEPSHRVRSALEHLKADYDGVTGNTGAPRASSRSRAMMDGRPRTRTGRTTSRQLRGCGASSCGKWPAAGGSTPAATTRSS